MAVTLKEAKHRAARLYLGRPGVFAVGTSVDDRGRPAIVITISSALSPVTLKSFPLTFEGYPVRLIVSEEPIPH